MTLWKQLDANQSPHIIVTLENNYVGNAANAVGAINIIRRHNHEVTEQTKEQIIREAAESIERELRGPNRDNW